MGAAAWKRPASEKPGNFVDEIKKPRFAARAVRPRVAWPATRMMLVAARHALRWRRWDDIYIVFQPSSAETHVFNETTALILKSLEHGPVSAQTAKRLTETALGLDEGALADGDYAFAVRRLEELGLIDFLDDGVDSR